MSVWASIKAKLGNILKGVGEKMIGSKSVESKLNVTVAISGEMEKALNLWSAMYRNKAPWLHEPDDKDSTRIVSLGLPAMIASEKARTALIEFESEITTPTEEVEVANPEYKNPPDMEMNAWGQEVPKVQPETIVEEHPTSDTARAEFLNEQYTKLKRQLRKQLEYGIALGGLIIKPYYVQNQAEDGQPTANIEFDFIRADCFFPLAFDNNGHITEAAFVQPKIDKNVVYFRLEYHKWQNNTLEIINKAYKSTRTDVLTINESDDLGKEIPLSEVPEWADLQEKTTIKDVTKPLFGYFKMPEANTIDMTSPLGVSGYSRVVSLIKDADIQYSTLLWEYEAGQMAIDIDRDALKPADGEGNSKMSHLQNRLYRYVDLSVEGDTYQPYSPALRDANYIAGLNTILMRIEDVTGLSRGTLSDASQEARTATELKILKQRSYQSNADIQQALEDALKDVIYAMNAYCDLYQITPEGEYDVNFEWDDSIIVDVDAELGKQITLLQNGLTSKKEVRQWYFGETERQAEEALAQIHDESMEDMEDNVAMQVQMGANAD